LDSSGGGMRRSSGGDGEPEGRCGSSSNSSLTGSMLVGHGGRVLFHVLRAAHA
jgi:hypothetical protein